MTTIKFLLVIALILTLNCVDKVVSQSASCTFEYNYNGLYSCKFAISDENKDFSGIRGDHMNDKADSDVKLVSNIDSSNVYSIPSIICERFKNLNEVDFSFGRLQKIDDGWLDGCESVESIRLNLNKIKTLSKNVFASQANLKQLRLNENKIVNLPDGIFDPLVNLEYLDLSQNALVPLTSDAIFDSLSKLTFLDLSYNKLRTLSPGVFKNLRNLKELSIGKNQLIDLPDNIFAPLINLESLAINSNKLAALHSTSFGANTKLTEFLFGFNNIVSFDEKILDISTSLRTVDASDNDCVARGYVNARNDANAADKMRVALKRCFENYQGRQ